MTADENEFVHLYPGIDQQQFLREQLLFLSQTSIASYLDTELVCVDGSVTTNSLLAALGFKELYSCPTFANQGEKIVLLAETSTLEVESRLLLLTSQASDLNHSSTNQLEVKGETIESDLDENLCSQSDGSIKEEAYLAAASESNCRLKHVDKKTCVNVAQAIQDQIISVLQILHRLLLLLPLQIP